MMRNLGYLWRITLLLLLATTMVSTSAALPLRAESGTLGTTAPTDTGGPVEATVNGTFRPAGHDSSDWYFTIEGTNNGTYARWGVAEFDTSGLFAGAIMDITGFELTLTQSNAYFTKDGAVAFFITEDTTTNIGPGSSLVYDSGDTLYGVGTQLDPKTPAGTGAFAEVADGHEDTYDLAPDLSETIKTYLIAQINSGSPVRVIVAPNDGDVAATWAGYSNLDYDGPKLTVMATMAPAARIFLPIMVQNFGSPSPSDTWTGQVTNQFSNCGLTRVFGFTLDRNGGLAGDRWVHYWADGWNGAWTMSQWTAFGTDTPWTGDEGNWDGVIDNRPRPGIWHVCMVPEEGSWDCLSNTVDVETSSDCQNGYQVYHITFRQN